MVTVVLLSFPAALITLKKKKKKVGYLRYKTAMETEVGPGHVRKPGHGYRSLAFIPGSYVNIMITLKFMPDIFGLQIYGFKNHSAFNEYEPCFPKLFFSSTRVFAGVAHASI